MRVVVCAHDPAWERSFEVVRRQLADALSNLEIVGIEHVGSTSVPGLAAKPVIDIDVIVRVEQVQPAIAALEAVGYAHRGELGIPDRHAFAAPADGIDRNVYVTLDGCLSLRNHLAVRDLLRADPALRADYADVKWRLAAREDLDIDGYTTGKSEVLQRILARAGIGDQDRALIGDANATNLPRS